MSAVIVTCPKCRKQQPVEAAIPPEGLRYACIACQTAFRVKLPPGAPPPPSPAPPVPNFHEMGLEDPTGASGPDLGGSDFLEEDLPAARSPGLGDDFQMDSGIDLPAAREDMPMPGDLPAPRDSMPMPDDFLAPRESVPRPDDLPPPRDSIPLPDDFLAPRESIPRPDDLLAPRDSMPLPGDLLSPVEGIGGRSNLPEAVQGRTNLPEAVKGGRTNLPESVKGGRTNLPESVAKAGQKNLPESVGKAGQKNLPQAVPGGPGGTNLPVSLAGANLPVSRLGSVPLATKAKLKQPSLDLDPFGGHVPSAEGSPLEELELGGSGGQAAGGKATLTPMKGLDPAFGLEIEGGSPASPEPESPRRPLNISVAAGAAPTADDDIKPLRPHASTKAPVSDAELERLGARPRPFLIMGIVAATVAVAGGAFLFLRARGAEPKPDEALGPIAAEIVADQYSAYQRGADRLLEVAGQYPEAVGLRAAAAENLLLAFLAHGAERSKLSQAEQILASLPKSDRPNAYAARANALLALAKGKPPSEVTNMLGMEASTPEGELVAGLRELGAVKRDAAAAAFKRLVAGRPDRVVGVYLTGRALEETKPADAMEAYRAVLARTPGHFGAALGVARLADGPAARLAAVQKLLDKKGSGVPRSMLAEAHVASGRAAQALGRSADAAASFAKALASDPQNASVNVALGEGYMFEGRYAEALQRFQAAGPAGVKTAAGKFGLGGALIATGKIQPGLAQIHQAATENPKDPRGLYYGGLASELSTPADLEAAAQSYRAALALDKKFLPASLRMAALMQRQGKPEDALAVLRAAEAAGAPATALQIAWGEALIVSKEPARAEEVFRKAIETTPKEVPAHLGLASSLEAQGKGEAARAVLEKALTDLPEAVPARERLAALTATLGHKEDAVAHYKTALASGRAPLATRVAMAKLQLELGQLDDAQVELDKVIDENPATPEALFTLARVWEARNDLVRAVQEYRRALRFDNLPAVQLSLGRVLLKLGKEPEAMAALDAAASLPEALVERGRVLYRKGDYEKALADFNGASKLAPQEPRAWMWKGNSHDRMGELDKASEAWTTALRLAPTDAETHYRVGRFELDKGRVKSSIDHLRKAAAGVPEKADWEAQLYFELGTAEVTAGSKPAALAAFKKYLEIAPSDAASRPEAKRQILRLGGR